jgi:hypothetical protein
MYTLRTTLRRSAVTSLLAAALSAGIAPAHSQAQVLAVSPAVRAVLKPLYPALESCARWTANTVYADRTAILFGTMDGSPPNVDADPYQDVEGGANGTLSFCAAAARAMRAVHLTGRLAHSATLRYVLANIAAYVSDSAQIAKDSGKLYFDLNSGDATAAQADFARVMNAEHAGDAALRAIAPYVSKL